MAQGLAQHVGDPGFDPTLYQQQPSQLCGFVLWKTQEFLLVCFRSGCWGRERNLGAAPYVGMTVYFLVSLLQVYSSSINAVLLSQGSVDWGRSPVNDHTDERDSVNLRSLSMF